MSLRLWFLQVSWCRKKKEVKAYMRTMFKAVERTVEFNRTMDAVQSGPIPDQGRLMVALGEAPGVANHKMKLSPGSTDCARTCCDDRP